MFKNLIFTSILLVVYALMNAFASAQEENTYRNVDLGVEIQKPDTWKFEEQSTAPLTLFIKPPLAQADNNLYIFVVLVVASVPGITSAEGFPAQREMIWKGVLGDTYRKLKEDAVMIANEQGQSLFFESEQGEKSAKWEEYYLVKDSILYLLQFMAPKSLFENYRKDFELIFNSFKLIKPSPEGEVTRELPEEELVLDASSDRVVFICDVDSASGEYLFLSAIPAAAKLNAGRPVVIATDGKLSESAKHFLTRYSPGKAYLLGSEHQGIKGEFIEQPGRLWDIAQTVVVSAKERTMAVIATPLAVRLGCPLLFDDDKLDSELKRLKPEHIVIVGEVNRDVTEFAANITTLKNVLDVAAFFGDFNYVAVTNTYLNEDKPDRSYLLAPMLAAYRNGVVYPIHKKVKFNFGVLTERIEEEGKEYLQGRIPVGQSEIKVKVPIREAVKELPTHFDDPYLDIGDGNGFVLTKIGDVKVIDGSEYAFSMRMIGALRITKFHDYQGENRVYLLTPHAAGIQKELLSFYAETSMPEYVAIVGTPASIPFGYQRDPVYFDSTMHEQELATDNAYANIDGDDYLELAVGRIVNSDVYNGSVNIAGIVTYDDMPGDWQKKALLIYPTSVQLEEASQVPMVFSSFEALLKNLEQEMKHAGFEVIGQYRDKATLDAVYPHLQGQALIAFAQHSDALRWSFIAGNETKHLVPRWDKTSEKLPPDIKVLPYFDAPTLIIGLGCDSGGLDTGIEPENTFLYGCFEKGAIGYIGNTRAAFPDTEEHAVKEMINDIIYQGATVGEAFKNGKNYLLYLFRNRKPYKVGPFKDYSLASGREFYQLVYYGEPALKMKAPKSPAAATIKEQRKTENSSQIALLTIQPSEEIWQYEVMDMKEVGKGPVEYLKIVSAPGLSYSSTEWGDYDATANPPRILPGVFVKYELPQDYSELKVSLEAGPDWCYQGYNIETLEDGKTYLLSNIAIIKYLPRDGRYESAGKVMLKLTWH
ncbi:hypothetical protein FJZ31_29050 [Candidatus Poribacteria bacterium]|nr:hypothetical protein [Candidatus Poribacteria bacterium]